MQYLKILGLVFLLALQSNPALAHSMQSNAGFMEGFWHPVYGFDHFLAMLSVGILSAQIGNRAIWTMPLTFVIMMAVGGWLGAKAIYIPFSEYILSISIIVLGFAIALNRQMPIIIVFIFVAGFGVFHGYAHGLEIPNVANALPYAAGFIFATASIHILGVVIALGSSNIKHGAILLRYSGAVMAGMGLELTLFMKDLS